MDAGASGAKTLACAEEALKKAAKLDPGLDGAWNCLAQLALEEGQLGRRQELLPSCAQPWPQQKTLQAMSMLFRPSPSRRPPQAQTSRRTTSQSLWCMRRPRSS